MPGFQDRFEVTFADGRRLVDWGVVWRIFFDRYRVEAFLDPSFQVLSPQEGIVGWTGLLPRAVEIDMDAAAASARQDADAAVRDLGLKVQMDGLSSADLKHLMSTELVGLDAAQSKFRALLAENARRNAQPLQANLGAWTMALHVAEGARDLSVIVLGIGGTLLTGGAGAPLAGLLTSSSGSVLGAVAKVQDQRVPMSVQEAFGRVVVGATIDFSFGLISLGVDKALKAAHAGKVTKQAIAILVDTGSGALTSLAMADPGPDGQPLSLQVATSDAYVDAVVKNTIKSAVEARFGKAGAKAVRGVVLPALAALMPRGDPKAGVAVKTLNSLAAKGIERAGVAALKPFFESAQPRGNPRAAVHAGAAANQARLGSIFP